MLSKFCGSFKNNYNHIGKILLLSFWFWKFFRGFLFESLTNLTVISKTAFTKIISLLTIEILPFILSLVKREIIFVNAVFEITVKSVKDSKKTLRRTSRTRKKAVILIKFVKIKFEWSIYLLDFNIVKRILKS